MNKMIVPGFLTPLQKFFIFLVIITSGTPLTQDYSLPNVLLILTFGLLVVRKEIRLNESSLHCGAVIIALYILWTFQYVSCPKNLSYSVIFKYCLIIFCTIQFCTNTKSSSQSKIEYFVKIIFYSSVISNILFLACVFGIDVPTIDSKTHTIPSFYYLGAAAYTEVYGFLGYRNCGIYWEPGLYQIYLNFALIYFLYYKDAFIKAKWLVVAYLLFSIYTTGSTTGLFLAALIVGFYVFTNKQMKTSVKLIIIAGIILVGGEIIYSYLMENLTTKMDSKSYVMRADDLTFGYELFMSNPFLGYGIANDIYSLKYAAEYGLERGDSNGLMNLLIGFGAVGFFVYFYYLQRFAKICVSFIRDRVFVLVLIWIIVSLCTEPISTHATVFFLIGLGLDNRIAYKRKQYISSAI